MLSTSLTNDIINCYSALYGQRYPGGTQANAGRISPLKSLVRQLQYSLHRWEMVALRAVSCTSVRSIRTLTRPFDHCRRHCYHIRSHAVKRHFRAGIYNLICETRKYLGIYFACNRAWVYAIMWPFKNAYIRDPNGRIYGLNAHA